MIIQNIGHYFYSRMEWRILVCVIDFASRQTKFHQQALQGTSRDVLALFPTPDWELYQQE